MSFGRLSLGFGLGSSKTASGTAPGPAAPTATATMTQLASANRVYQRDTTSGGGQGKGAGSVPVAFSAATGTGTLNFRCSSGGSTRGDLQAETVGPTISATGAQTVTFTGVDARLGWFYLDVRDASGWTNGTTLIGMGVLSSISGQSLAKRFVQKLTGDTTFATMGITPDANSRVYVTTETYNPSTLPTSWELPADAGNFTATPCVQYLNQMVAFTGVNNALIGHAESGTPQDYWQPGATGATRLAAVVAAAGGKWEYDLWLQGHDDAKNGIFATPYQESMEYRVFGSGGVASLNGLAASVKYLVFTIPNINVNTQYGFARQMNEVRKGGKGWATAHSATYVDVEGLAQTDGIHESQVGGVSLGNSFYRAAVRDNLGPALTSATRSGTTITATLSNSGTDLQVTGAWYSRFVAYASGSVQTKWPISGGAKIDKNTVTLTLANDPGDGTALDLWLGIPFDGDAGTNDPSGIMVRDDRTDSDGITYGRTFQPSTAAIAVAAPSPGGTQNTPPGGVVASASFYDMTMTSPTYSSPPAELSAFGTMLSAGFGTGVRTELGSMPEMSIMGFFVCPTSVTGTSVMFELGGVFIAIDTSKKVRFQYNRPTGTTTAVGPSALTSGHAYCVRAEADANGARIYLQDITAGTAGTRYYNSATLTGAPYAVTGGQVCFAAHSGAASFFVNSSGGMLGEWSIWQGVALTGTTFTAPTAPLVGNETGLFALFRPNSTDNGKSAARYL